MNLLYSCRSLVFFFFLPAIILSVGCGSSSSDSGGDDPACLVSSPVSPRFQGCAGGDELAVTSNDFDDGGVIPLDFACTEADVGGGNEIPTISWTDVPDGTLSFAIVMEDITEDESEDLSVPSPNVEGEGFIHTIAFNIAADATSTENLDGMGEVVFAANDNGDAEYFGPCPPEGDGAHTYEFMVYPLDVEDLTTEVADTTDTSAVLEAIIAADVGGSNSISGIFTHP